MVPTPAAIPVAPFYSDEHIDAIIEAVGGFPSETMLYVRPDYLYLAADGEYGPVEESRRWALEDCIQYTAKVYLGDKKFDRRPTKLELHKLYKDAASLCEALANTLRNQRARLFGVWIAGVSEEPECPNVRQIIEDLSRLRAWLAWSETNTKPLEESQHGGNRRKSEESLDLWVGHLTGIYRYVFERKPGFSVGAATQDTGGPFARYLDACIRPILGDETPSLKALRSRFRRLQRYGHFKS